MPFLVRYFVHCLRNTVDRKFMVVMLRGVDIRRETTCFCQFQQNWVSVYKKYLCVNTTPAKEGKAAIIHLAKGVDPANQC
jgi:hypothetical protein